MATKQYSNSYSQKEIKDITSYAKNPSKEKMDKLVTKYPDRTRIALTSKATTIRRELGILGASGKGGRRKGVGRKIAKGVHLPTEVNPSVEKIVNENPKVAISATEVRLPIKSFRIEGMEIIFTLGTE